MIGWHLALFTAQFHEALQGLALTTGDFTDSGTGSHQGSNELQVIQVGLGVLTSTGCGLETGPEGVSTLPHPQGVWLQASQSGDGSNAIQRSGL